MNAGQIFTEYILGPLLGSAAVVYAGWSARRAEHKQKREDAAQEAPTRIIDSYDRLNEDLQARIAVLNALVSGLDGRLEAHRKRIEALENESDRQRSVIRSFVSYVDSLLNIMRAHNVPVPTRPKQLDPYWG